VVLRSANRRAALRAMSAGRLIGFMGYASNAM
jgi:hypothetical protein